MAEPGGEFPTGKTSRVIRSQAVAPEIPQIEQQRMQAIAAMEEVAKRLRDPNVRPYLREPHPYAAKTHAVLLISQNPEARADYVEIMVDQCLKEGDRAGAIKVLSAANAAKLDLPQYNSEFILRLYEEAFRENNFKDAQAIANEMLDRGDRIVGVPDSEKVKEKEGWENKEQTAFEKRANSVLAKEIDPTDEESVKELNAIYWQFRSARRDHFASNIAQEVAKKIVKFFTEQAEGQKTDREKIDLLIKAASYAEGAGLLEETRTLLKKAKEVNPDWVTRFTRKVKELAGAKGK